MNIQNMRSRLLATTMIGGAVIVAATTFAAAPAVAQEATEVDEVVITGSRIVRRDAVAESPIVTVTNEELTQAGSTTVEHYLNTLPQVTAGLSSQSNNPSSNGRAFIDLRGLGSGRNLVLIDGRRPMGSTAGGTVDVNTIPAALVERVEIITGGAASTYGADAVSGVVNFILNDNFEGVELDAQYRITEEDDGEEWGYNLTFGGNFDGGRGNAVFDASYFNRQAMYKGAREWAANASNSTNTFPGGSAVLGANAPSNDAIAAVFGGGNCAGNGGWAGFGFNPDGSLFCTGVAGNSAFDVFGYTGPANWVAANFAPDIFSYEFEPDNILVLPMERYSLFTRVNYEVNPYFRPYAQAIYTNYNATQELAATPASATTGWNVPISNPFIPTDLGSILAIRPNPTAPFAFNKRFSDLGGRTGSTNHDVWQTTIGAEGNFIGTDTWTYDIYASYGRSVLNEIQGGNVRRDRVGNLLGDNTFYTPGDPTDAPTIAQQAEISGGACPNGLNLFGNTPIDPTCQAWISLEAKNLTVVQQSVVEGIITGDLFTLPAGPVQGAFGASYREIDFDFRPDGGLQPGLVAGFNQQLPTNGFQHWVDVFGEVRVPLLANLPLVQDLSTTLGYRISDNSRSGDSDSWKINLDWTVVDWARFRGGYQTAIRSPTIAELFAPQLNNYPTFTNQDPCDTSTPATDFNRSGPNGAQVAALCATQSAAAGLPAFTGPGQAVGITGGNPDLEPEESTSWTAGFVLGSPFSTGGWADSLYMTADYWSIELENVISSVGASTIVQRCFNRDGANPTYDANNEWCQLFDRDPNSGQVINLLQLSRNQSFINTSGVDITFGGGFELGAYGNLNFNVLSTWVEKYESQTTNVDPVNDFVGSIGSGTGSATPEWRHTVNLGWDWDKLSMTATGRYIDEMINAATITGGTGTGVDSMWYLDLRGTYDLNDTVQLRMGVNNVTNEEPPLYSPNIQSNTDPSTYDVLGRRYFIGINARF